MGQERLKLEKEIRRLPAGEQLKLLKNISNQLHTFQHEESQRCSKDGHQFGRWYFQVKNSKKLAGSQKTFAVINDTEEEWTRRCMNCGYVEKVTHQPSSSVESISKQESEMVKEKPYMKMKKMYHDI